ncbi:MAG: hypothetical protein Q7K43_06575 [Candidatus Woesearchaeota archaeon]|nr:hypothetical protein [Candidatus Woesearchaeota archaeon]
MINKILIIGNAGSGKNYCGEILSKETKIPFYDIDNIIWIKKFCLKRTKTERRIIVNKIIKRKEWIFGAFPRPWNLKIASAAKQIVILIEKRQVTTYRVIKRYFKRKYSQVPPKENIFELWNLLTYCWKDFTPKGESGKYCEMLKQKYQNKVMVLNGKRERDEYFEKISVQIKKDRS